MSTRDFISNRSARSISLQIQMIRETSLTIASVDFLESQIERKLLEIDLAEAEYRYEEVSRLKDQLSQLLSKLHREEKQIDDNLLKYKRLRQHEEKELLSRLSKEKQVSVWGFSSYTGWVSTGESLQVKA
jgi:hypothetical protein